jgi:2-polyprenyl-6-methoxyphenol hydroxylase-like FAD-dependent oxidoreductase
MIRRGNGSMPVLIIGGGIGGLSLALSLQQAGVRCRIFEAAQTLKEIGVGINILPHAVGTLETLGVADALLAHGIETREVCFYTSHGQLVDAELRGRAAGHSAPQISAHRADLHGVLVDAVRERLGPDAITLAHRCSAIRQDAGSVTVDFVDPAGRPLPAVMSDVAIGCDGINSVVRRTLHPNEGPLVSHGTTQYRGTTIWPPFLTGASMAYVGTYETGKLVVYPIRKDLDEQGRRLTNWVVETAKAYDDEPDWTRKASADAFIDLLETWSFDWLDIPAMIRAADTILEYPVVDREPLPWWTQGRITLLGDAAHPMLPRGSNGAAQSMLDGQSLARVLAGAADRPAALKAYEDERRPVTERVVFANRTAYPDAILRVVQERTGGKPFAHIDDVISRNERDQWQSRYRQVAGFERTEAPQATV